uniref:Short-chain dehydrogenase/reductase family protein n=1 Tax=Mycena chlorophos TaxID=658473 RepID=A0ABQ0L3N3_MYCCL|nr:short-chain dehydrogenase/reductase family protein [Mycena chlorophos]
MSAYQKSVLITGCSAGGIGHALALEYHRYGYRVFATARKLESMAELAAQGIETLQLDVSNAVQIQEVRQTLSVKTDGKLDILVNNAGQIYDNAITDSEVERVREIVEVNLVSPIIMTKEFSPLLIKAGGRVVLIGSITAILPLPFTAAYAATKAGIHSFSNVARIELAPFGVKVINIVTGVIQTNLWRDGKLPDDSLYKPMEDLYITHRLNIPQKGSTPVEDYARGVVRETTKTVPSDWVYLGHNSLMAWAVETFAPRWVVDIMMNRTFGFNEFVERLARRKAE